MIPQSKSGKLEGKASSRIQSGVEISKSKNSTFLDFIRKQALGIGDEDNEPCINPSQTLEYGGWY